MFVLLNTGGFIHKWLIIKGEIISQFDKLWSWKQKKIENLGDKSQVLNVERSQNTK